MYHAFDKEKNIKLIARTQTKTGVYIFLIDSSLLSPGVYVFTKSFPTIIREYTPCIYKFLISK